MGVVLALAVGSCAYDPNYTGGAYGAGYGGDYGYGEGYGYGYSGFSTALFVSTGDPRWGYDPYCHSYYDYGRRCYYDPYLYGYYPRGYRPVFISGVPHPHGYNRSYCPPPNRVRNYALPNYHNREQAYKHSDYAWAHQVRQPRGDVRSQSQIQPPRPRTGTPDYSGTRNPAPAPGGYPRTRSGSTYNNGGGNPATRRQSGLPSSYNVPIQTTPPENSGRAMDSGRGRANSYQGAAQPRTSGPTPPPQAQRQGPPQAQRQGQLPQQQRADTPAPATRVRGLGEGKDGRDDDKSGGGRSRR
jgi:hypothetical protein